MDLSPALLPLLCVFVVLEREAGGGSSDRYYQSTLAAHFPHRQCGLEHVGVCPGFWLQGWPEDGAGECLQSLVSEPFFRKNEVNRENDVNQNGPALALTHFLSHVHAD